MANPIREFSARVSIDLIVDGNTLPVSQTGGDFLIMSHPFAVPPTKATLVLSVDDSTTRFQVYLTEGISPQRDEQPMVILSSDDLAA